MSEVSGPVVATTLVLLAVFVPAAFLPGITGELYRQFALDHRGGDGVQLHQRPDHEPGAGCAGAASAAGEEKRLLPRFRQSLQPGPKTATPA